MTFTKAVGQKTITWSQTHDPSQSQPHVSEVECTLDVTDMDAPLAPPRSSSPVMQDNSPDATPLPSSSPQLTHPTVIDPDEEEIAPVRKHVPHETLKLWENLLGPRGFEVVDGKLKRTPSKSWASQSHKQVPLSPTKPKTQLVGTTDNGSVLSNFKRTNSFAIKPKEEIRRKPFTKGAITGTPGAPSALQRVAEQPVASGSKLPAEQSRKGGLFSEKKFLALGEANDHNVRSVVEDGNGFWTTNDLEDVDFVIVRLVRFVFLPVLPYAFSDWVVAAALFSGQKGKRRRNRSTERNVGWRNVSLRIGYVTPMNTSHFGQSPYQHQFLVLPAWR